VNWVRQNKPPLTFNKGRKPLPQVNPTPYQKGLTDEGQVGYTELSKTIMKDDEQSIKPGAPYVGVWGASGTCGKCPNCMKPLLTKPFGTKMLIFCPHCRRQMYRTVDRSGKPDFGSNPHMITYGVPESHNLPLQSELPESVDQNHNYVDPLNLVKAY
jgi:hypothetical protein